MASYSYTPRRPLPYSTVCYTPTQVSIIHIRCDGTVAAPPLEIIEHTFEFGKLDAYMRGILVAKLRLHVQKKAKRKKTVCDIRLRVTTTTDVSTFKSIIVNDCLVTKHL